MPASPTVLKFPPEGLISLKRLRLNPLTDVMSSPRRRSQEGMEVSTPRRVARKALMKAWLFVLFGWPNVC